MQKRIKHENNGACEKCHQLIDQGDVFVDLKRWFMAQQSIYPDFHLSCGVRGRVAQEAALQRGASKASFGRSAHNYEPALAIDTFFLADGKAVWPKERYLEICGEFGEHLPDLILWFGRKGAPFYELPHFQMENWKELIAEGKAKLTDED